MVLFFEAVQFSRSANNVSTLRLFTGWIWVENSVDLRHQRLQKLGCNAAWTWTNKNRSWHARSRRGCLKMGYTPKWHSGYWSKENDVNWKFSGFWSSQPFAYCQTLRSLKLNCSASPKKARLAQWWWRSSLEPYLTANRRTWTDQIDPNRSK